MKQAQDWLVDTQALVGGAGWSEFVAAIIHYAWIVNSKRLLIIFMRISQ